MSTTITGLLEEMVPQLHDLAKVSRALRSGKVSAAKQALRHMVGNSMAEFMTTQQLPLKGGK